jgi:drug/metabolite transporter (DMT)-like permease
MLGGFLALLSALTFAFNNAGIRRGVLTGSVAQAMALSLPIGVLIFFLVLLASGSLGALASFSTQSVILLSVAGVIHFAWGRYCDYRATKAMGVNLVGPVQQLSLILTLVLAVIILREEMTPLRILGIALVILGPWLSRERKEHASMAFLGTGAQYKANLTEGYFYAGLSVIGFGVSPILIRMAMEQNTVSAGVAGGFISYAAASVPILLILLLPGRWQHVKTIRPESAKVVRPFRYRGLHLADVSLYGARDRAGFGRYADPAAVHRISPLFQLGAESRARSARRTPGRRNIGLVVRSTGAVGQHRSRRVMASVYRRCGRVVAMALRNAVSHASA